jgi:hypothetical protein
VSAARKRADARYRAKDFAGAAAALREVAGDLDDPTAEDLRSSAVAYEQVGTQIETGNVNRSANPPIALAAFRKALQLDANVGGGAHATFLRTKLGEIAPKAAASYMVQNKYEAARKACDAAVNYGSGDDPMVARVRKALDKKAGELYQQAVAERKTNRKAADGLLRRVLAMVPAESGWYAKAYALLNANDSSRSRDEDE